MAPLDSVTVTADWAGAGQRCGVDDVAAFGHRRGRDVRLTVVVSIVSVIAVIAAAGLMASASKLPPRRAVMVADTELGVGSTRLVGWRSRARAAGSWHRLRC